MSDEKEVPLIQRDILKCWQSEQEAFRASDKQRSIDIAIIKADLEGVKKAQKDDKNELNLLREAKHKHSNHIQNINGQITCIFNDMSEIKAGHNHLIETINENEKHKREDMAFIREKLAGDAGRNKVLGWILQKAATPIIVGVVGALLALIIVKGGK